MQLLKRQENANAIVDSTGICGILFTGHSNMYSLCNFIAIMSDFCSFFMESLKGPSNQIRFA